MKTWQVWIGILVIFLSGIVTGVLGVGFFLHQRLNALREEGPSALNGVALRALDWKLDFTDRQWVQAEEVVLETHREFRQFRAEHHLRLRAIVTRALDAMESILNAEQKPAWVKLRNGIEDHMERFGAPEGG
ncbi:MAG: hypothetical protein V2A76_06045 [Planctomycetota bacterium]